MKINLVCPNNHAISVDLKFIEDDTWVQCYRCGALFLNPHKKLRFAP